MANDNADMSPAFKSAVEIILAHEGGYVNDPKDPGGETRFGISKRSYPNIDIKTLTRQDAAKIYYRDYWQKIRGDSLPFGVALVLFDIAVNMGVSRAIKALQKAVGVKQDGKFGEQTLAATNALNKNALIEALTTNRVLYYTTLDTWSIYGAGWTGRAIETLSSALLSRETI